MLPYVDVDFCYGWEDICFKNGPIVTPSFFRDVVMPRYKRIRKILDEYGIKTWMVDSDGDIRAILPYMIEGGISHIFPFEVNGSGHPAGVLEKYEGQIGILGGFDKMKLLAGQDAITEYMESLVPLVKKGRFIPYVDHLCPPDVKQEDYLYYLELKEQLFGV